MLSTVLALPVLWSCTGWWDLPGTSRGASSEHTPGLQAGPDTNRGPSEEPLQIPQPPNTPNPLGLELSLHQTLKGDTRPPHTRQELAELINHQWLCPSLRARATEALAKLAAGSCTHGELAIFTRGANENFAPMANAAIKGLTHCGHPRAGEAIGHLLTSLPQPGGDRYGDTPRPELIIAGGRLKAPGITPLLLELANSDRTGTRLAALLALAHLGEDRAVPGLISTLSAPDGDSRRVAALALGQLGAVEAMGPLAALSRQDQDPVVRAAAARVVIKLNTP